MLLGEDQHRVGEITLRALAVVDATVIEAPGAVRCTSGWAIPTSFEQDHGIRAGGATAYGAAGHPSS